MFSRFNIDTALWIGILFISSSCWESMPDESVETHKAISSLDVKIGATARPAAVLASDLLVAAADREVEDDLDLTVVEVESEAARKLLESNVIKVRNRKTEFQPTGRVPIPTLETVSDEMCRERLKEATQNLANAKEGEVQFVDGENIFVALNEDLSTWISRASGVYKFTRTKESMIAPTKFKSFKEAVQAALDYVGRKQLVTLAENEEMDILFISSVENAMSTVEEISQERRPKEWQERISAIDPKSALLEVYDPEELTFDKIGLKEEFTSDFYVGFGRRLNGIPVIGSQLVVRLDGNGETAMVLKQWRASEEPQGRLVSVSDKSLAELIIAHPEFYERYSQKEVSPRDITVIGKKCGYMAAPADFRQQELRPGCEVTFSLFESRDESHPVIIVPLDGGEPGTLWGKKGA